MAVDYTGVLEDLRAKRDAMNELIAALENVARLGVSAPPLNGHGAAVGRSVGRSVGRYKPRASEPRDAEATGDARLGRRKWDDPILRELSRMKAGLNLKDLTGAVGGKSGSVFGVLKRLVRDGQVTKHGTLYRAAAAAKEAG